MSDDTVSGQAGRGPIEDERVGQGASDGDSDSGVIQASGDARLKPSRYEQLETALDKRASSATTAIRGAGWWHLS